MLRVDVHITDAVNGNTRMVLYGTSTVTGHGFDQMGMIDVPTDCAKEFCERLKVERIIWRVRGLAEPMWVKAWVRIKPLGK